MQDLETDVHEVLIVDDDRTIGSVLARLLQRHNMHAVAVASGAAALNYLATHQVSVVVLDYMMPEMDGLDVLAAMRRDEALRQLPVVMYSAFADEDIRRRAHDCGASEWWVKSRVNINEMAERLHKLVA